MCLSSQQEFKDDSFVRNLLPDKGHTIRPIIPSLLLKLTATQHKPRCEIKYVSAQFETSQVLMAASPG